MIISVVISIYNSEAYLVQCISSLLKQSYNDIEILLINDGSTDNSERICLDFEKSDSRVRYYKKKNGGLSSARNYGIAVAQGDYIMFLDSDDWFDADMIATMVAQAEKGKYDLVSQGFHVEFLGESYTRSICLENDISSDDVSTVIAALEDKGLFNSACNKLYKRSIIQENEIRFSTGTEPGEDLLFNCDFFRRINAAKGLTYCGYHYVKRDSVSLTSRYYENYYEKVLQFLESRKTLYEDVNMESAIAKKHIYNTTTSYAISIISNLYNKHAKLRRLDRIGIISKMIDNKDITVAIQNVQYMNLYVQLLSATLRTHAPILIDLIYSILFFFRNHFSGIYLRFRKRVLYG